MYNFHLMQEIAKYVISLIRKLKLLHLEGNALIYHTCKVGMWSLYVATYPRKSSGNGDHKVALEALCHLRMQIGKCNTPENELVTS